MVSRVFLGWDQPFVGKAADWLLQHRETLPFWLLVTPTNQSARRLREAMVAREGAMLSPKTTTPGGLLKSASGGAAPDWMEHAAWIEVLEQVTDWTDYQELFPRAPDPESGWEGGFGGELVRLRRALQENSLTLGRAARVLSSSIEAGRWDALARLEQQVERKLEDWGWKSRSRILAGGLSLPEEFPHIVIAGVTGMPPILEKALLEWNGSVSVLISAPEQEADSFNDLGIPLPCWAERVLPWPEDCGGSVRLVADPRQQADEALRAVAGAGTASDQVALGAPDSETGDLLAGVFTRAGWLAFHPGSAAVLRGLRRWFKVWLQWLADPKLATFADLLALPETGGLIGGRRAERAENLSKLRDLWMAIRPVDLRQHLEGALQIRDREREMAEDCLRAIDFLEKWRNGMLHGDFSATMERLLDALGRDRPQTNEESIEIRDWLEEAAPLISQLRRSPAFWIDLMTANLSHPPPAPPENRVIDIQGWLELLFEPGGQLVLCGMNEGKVPSGNHADPWLGAQVSQLLGLAGNAERAARDAYLYQAMCEARRHHGRVDAICSKSDSDGGALLPSRLLLAASPEDLPDRVKFLFRGVEPPEAGLRWHADWRWQPRVEEVGRRLPVTSLAAWIACPFRFYLKYALQMQSPEPGRVEWNARDFGNVAHEVVERWGRDTEARDFSKSEAIHGWLSNELDKVVSERFGDRVPLAVQIQTESLRQRFLWLARVQALARAGGWEVIEVEHKFEIPVDDMVIVAKIDRIDRHRDSGELRVLDYKTGKVEGVDKAHRKKITSRTTWPEHLGSDCPVVYQGSEKGKEADFRWTNLQLPLYAAAVEHRDSVIPRPCYFTIGSTEAHVEIQEWSGFSSSDLVAARSCAEWVARQIRAGVFWPPAERVAYDDFAILSAGRPLADMFARPAD